MTKTINIYVRLVAIYNTRGLYEYTNSKLDCIYLPIISMKTNDLTFGNSDRYDSFNKLGENYLQNIIGLMYKLSFYCSLNVL